MQPNEKPADPAALAESQVPPAPNSPAALAGLYGSDESLAYCSFDPRTVQGIALLDKCEEAPDRKLSEMANIRFRLAHVYGHRVELTNPETGEVFSALRTCLISDKGEVFACVSEGIRKAIVRLCRQHGLPPWKQPVPVVVTLKRLANGHNWLTVLNDPEANPKESRK